METVCRAIPFLLLFGAVVGVGDDVHRCREGRIGAEHGEKGLGEVFGARFGRFDIGGRDDCRIECAHKNQGGEEIGDTDED